jgi:hypothetical protein
MSWLITILNWLLGRLKRQQAQQRADAAAITQNQEAAHAVEQVEARPPDDQRAVSDRMRRGTF